MTNPRPITNRSRFVVGFAGVVLAAGGGDPAIAQDLQKCDAPVGTLAVVEPQDEVLKRLARYELETPTPILRRMVQESGCFIVVERGRALRSMAQERELASSGALTGDANVGAGQMQAADFYLTPEVLFSDDDAGGIGGAVGGLLGRGVAAVAGGLKFKEAETSILISATRSGVQVASAQGKARKMDFALGAFRWLGPIAGAAGGYTSTDEGKVIAASLVDNYNNIVASVRGDPNLPPLTPEEVRAVVTGEAKDTGGFEEGDVVSPKIDNVEVYAAPASDASVLTRVTRVDVLVYLGTEENGFLEVQSPAGVGWIRRVLVTENDGSGSPPVEARPSQQPSRALSPAGHPGLTAAPGRFTARVSGPHTVTIDGVAGFGVTKGSIGLSLANPSMTDNALLLTRMGGGRPAPGTYPIGDFMALAIAGGSRDHFSGWGGAGGMQFRTKSGTITFTSSSADRLAGWTVFEAVDSEGRPTVTVEAAFDARCSAQGDTGCH